MNLERLAGMKGIKLKGKLTLEIDQDVCAEDLGKLLAHGKGSEEGQSYYQEFDEDDLSYQKLQSQSQPQRKAPWLSQNQKPSHPNLYPISAGLMSYRE